MDPGHCGVEAVLDAQARFPFEAFPRVAELLAESLVVRGEPGEALERFVQLADGQVVEHRGEVDEVEKDGVGLGFGLEWGEGDDADFQAIVHVDEENVVDGDLAELGQAGAELVVRSEGVSSGRRLAELMKEIEREGFVDDPRVGWHRGMLLEWRGILLEKIQVNQSINQSIDHKINRIINQAINQSIEKSINQSINQSNKKLINQSIDCFIHCAEKTGRDKTEDADDAPFCEKQNDNNCDIARVCSVNFVPRLLFSTRIFGACETVFDFKKATKVNVSTEKGLNSSKKHFLCTKNNDAQFLRKKYAKYSILIWKIQNSKSRTKRLGRFFCFVNFFKNTKTFFKIFSKFFRNFFKSFWNFLEFFRFFPKIF